MQNCEVRVTFLLAIALTALLTPSANADPRDSYFANQKQAEDRKKLTCLFNERTEKYARRYSDPISGNWRYWGNFYYLHRGHVFLATGSPSPTRSCEDSRLETPSQLERFGEVVNFEGTTVRAIRYRLGVTYEDGKRCVRDEFQNKDCRETIETVFYLEDGNIVKYTGTFKREVFHKVIHQASGQASGETLRRGHSRAINAPPQFHRSPALDAYRNIRSTERNY